MFKVTFKRSFSFLDVTEDDSLCFPTKETAEKWARSMEGKKSPSKFLGEIKIFNCEVQNA